ncbi:EPYC protein, partial [Atractosteus spatula]|uniref:Epiphycan n=1 Tax=Lepisosteus oculatus TaxID=7918 RepID=W5NHX7_LEPOC|nr:PREDICTED: epiphycan [Lepisosteus oculatus]MBN3326546.1 EPYC protein [Atractosteus spatula]
MKTFVNIVLGLFVVKAVFAVPSRQRRQAFDFNTYDAEHYDVDLENLHLENQDTFNYDDELTIDEPQIEIGTLPPLVNRYQQPSTSVEEEEEELPLKPLTPAQSSGGSGLLGPDTQAGLPTCLLCTCLGGSVYCDDVKLETVPPLPKETTHFYARYNKIKKINKSDFAEMNKMKRIDLTSNQISEIDEDAFRSLPQLEELVVRENKIRQLPELPSTMTLIDVSHNKLGSNGIKNEAFKDMHNLMYLYLTDNNLNHIPLPLPEPLRSLHLQNNNIQMMHEDTFCNLKNVNYIRKALEDVRLDGNPINLSRTPQAYICLPRVPTGRLY